MNREKISDCNQKVQYGPRIVKVQYKQFIIPGGSWQSTTQPISHMTSLRWSQGHKTGPNTPHCVPGVPEIYKYYYIF